MRAPCFSGFYVIFTAQRVIPCRVIFNVHRVTYRVTSLHIHSSACHTVYCHIQHSAWHIVFYMRSTSVRPTIHVSHHLSPSTLTSPSTIRKSFSPPSLLIRKTNHLTSKRLRSAFCTSIFSTASSAVAPKSHKRSSKPPRKSWAEVGGGEPKKAGGCDGINRGFWGKRKKEKEKPKGFLGVFW